MKVFASRLSSAVIAGAILAAVCASPGLASQSGPNDNRRGEPGHRAVETRVLRPSQDRDAAHAQTRAGAVRPAKKPPIGTNEFYNVLAKQKLDHEDGAGQDTHHSLEVGRDDEELVICEAGCSNEAEQVVFSAPRLRLQTHVTEFEPASSHAADDAPSETSGPINPRARMPCVAGCAP